MDTALAQTRIAIASRATRAAMVLTCSRIRRRIRTARSGTTTVRRETTIRTTERSALERRATEECSDAEVYSQHRQALDRSGREATQAAREGKHPDKSDRPQAWAH